jgi:hypothetical protein
MFGGLSLRGGERCDEQDGQQDQPGHGHHQ